MQKLTVRVHPHDALGSHLIGYEWVGGLIREVVVVVEQVVNRVELNLDWPHSGRPLSLHAI